MKFKEPRIVVIRADEAFKLRDTEPCIIWNGPMRNGKENYRPYLIEKGRYISIRRRIWTKKFGEIPEHFIVYTACSTKACVNPNHFFLECWEHDE